MAGKTAFLALLTVTGTFHVSGDGDKAKIVETAEGLKDARRVEVDVKTGDRVEVGSLLPCIETALIDRGVLVEREVENVETLGDVSGSNEGATDVEVTALTEEGKTAAAGKAKAK